MLVIEDASLELVPKEFQGSRSCRSFFEKFGVTPASQILDDNFHHDIIRKLPKSEKRGRPDVVHFALLDATSTPLFQSGKLEVIIHTLDDMVIEITPGTRIPRTLLRFNGVMSKLLSQPFLSNKELEGNELIRLRGTEKIDQFLSRFTNRKVVALSRIGEPVKLRKFVHEILSMGNGETKIWIVGGFARGHFEASLLKLADYIVSISRDSLPAHVVTARLTYDLEVELE